MKKRSPVLQRVGFTIFTISTFLGVLLIITSAWPDLESTFYGFSRYPDEEQALLSCPVLMTAQDRGHVTIKLHNPFDKTITRYVKTQISSPMIIHTLRVQVELQPGETRALSWEVGNENIDLDNFIFAFVQVLPVSSLKLTGGTCGTLVLNLPFRGGSFLFYTTLILASIGLVSGLWLWTRNADRSDPSMVQDSLFMRIMALAVFLGVVVSMIGLWFGGLIVLVIMLLAWSVFLYPRKSTN